MSNRFFPNYPDYIITSKFGMRTHPVTRVKKMHNGIDLVATKDGKTGQTDYVMAHTGGVVESVGYNSSSGYYVKIQVSDNSIMVYYHLKEKSSLKKGAAVKKGDKLGYMGKSGSATGAHLHWGIKKNGEWIDPEPYLDKDYTEGEKTVTIEMPVLKKGAKREEVKTLQILLNAKLTEKLGNEFVQLVVDGSFGAKTLAAVEKFQDLFGLGVDGSVGKDTWTELLKG